MYSLKKMMMRQWFFKLQHFRAICLLFLLLVAQLVRPQAPSLRSNILQVDGKPFDINANVIFQDAVGFMWIGTNNGLFRYDAQDIIEYQFNVFDKRSIPNNTVNSILEDDFGNLWIGTESYLVFFDRAKEEFHGFYKDTTASVLGKSAKGNIYVNLWKSGLIRVHPNPQVDSLKFEVIDESEAISQLLPAHKRINAFVEDVHQRPW
ncbi:MAG: two-component regulator propeller domain-containing protein, partial [Bacteroidota bacterium]